MNKNVIVAVTLVLVGIVGIPSNTFASPSKHSQAECKAPAPLKPEALYGFALNAPSKSEALELLKKAEECYRIEGNLAGVNKTRNQIMHIDNIDFAKNRLESLRAWKIMVESFRQEGRYSEAAKLEARIRELEKTKD